MKKHIISTLLILFGIFTAPILIAAPSLAAPSPCDDVCNCDVAPSVKDAAGCNDSSNDKLPDVVIKVVNGIIAVLGIAAVIFIVIGGVQYMTSMGDAGKAKKARDTILYAVIGLIICALAFAIVNFVIKNLL